MIRQKRKSRGRWLVTAVVLYAAFASGGIGTATYLDATRSSIRETIRETAREVLLPPGVFDPQPTALPPCPSDAIPKPEELRGSREYGTVAASELNIRREPSMAGKVLGQLYRGDQVEVLERPTVGPAAGWIRTKGGWVGGRFVDVTDARQADTPSPPPCPLLQPFCPPGATSIFNPGASQ